LARIEVNCYTVHLLGGLRRLVFSDRVHDHVAKPRNVGEMADADVVGLAGVPGDGPHVKIWFKLDGTRIIQASYNTNGCPSSVACASALCELATGREIEKMLLLEATDLITFPGGLPEGKGYYADLAIQALRHALEVN
jgi:NifU-like protein involved in Fe-S cluster formation